MLSSQRFIAVPSADSMREDNFKVLQQRLISFKRRLFFYVRLVEPWSRFLVEIAEAQAMSMMKDRLASPSNAQLKVLTLRMCKFLAVFDPLFNFKI